MNAHTLFRIPIILAIALGMAAPAGFTALAEAPPNDDFDFPKVINTLPYHDEMDTSEATWVEDDPDSCHSNGSVWYSFTPTDNIGITANTSGSYFDTTLSVYTGSRGSLSVLACNDDSEYGTQSKVDFLALGGTTYYFLLGFCCGSGGNGGGNLVFSVNEVPSPPNDDFAYPENIELLDFQTRIDLTAATLEEGEPLPSCREEEPINGSVWYKYVPLEPGSISFRSDEWSIYPVVAAYTGDSYDKLIEIGCSRYSERKTLEAQAGVPYYFQLATRGGRLGEAPFELIITPPPEIGWYEINPSDPSVYDIVNFCADVWDPGNIGIDSKTWVFGDGEQISPTDYCVVHKYAADGDYTVNFLVTTLDGRSTSRTNILEVRTHDVAITRVTAPISASARQTRTITVDVKNWRYPENVRLVLYKSVVGGYQAVGYLTQYVPVRAGNRTSRFTFNYTFTPEDAALGKVTFKAVAELQEARDAFPADNEAVSTPPTKVSGRLAPASSEAINPQ